MGMIPSSEPTVSSISQEILPVIVQDKTQVLARRLDITLMVILTLGLLCMAFGAISMVGIHGLSAIPSWVGPTSFGIGCTLFLFALGSIIVLKLLEKKRLDASKEAADLMLSQQTLYINALNDLRIEITRLEGANKAYAQNLIVANNRQREWVLHQHNEIEEASRCSDENLKTVEVAYHMLKALRRASKSSEELNTINFSYYYTYFETNQDGSWDEAAQTVKSEQLCLTPQASACCLQAFIVLRSAQLEMKQSSKVPFILPNFQKFQIAYAQIQNGEAATWAEATNGMTSFESSDNYLNFP